MNSESKILGRVAANGHAGTDAAVHLAHNLIDRAAKHLETSEEKLRQTARSAEETLKTSLQTAKSRGKQAGTTTRSMLQEYPFAAIGIAVGVGLVIALLAGGHRQVEDSSEDTEDGE